MKLKTLLITIFVVSEALCWFGFYLSNVPFERGEALAFTYGMSILISLVITAFTYMIIDSNP